MADPMPHRRPLWPGRPYWIAVALIFFVLALLTRLHHDPIIAWGASALLLINAYLAGWVAYGYRKESPGREREGG
jgi:hypothetical protein